MVLIYPDQYPVMNGCLRREILVIRGIAFNTIASWHRATPVLKWPRRRQWSQSFLGWSCVSFSSTTPLSPDESVMLQNVMFVDARDYWSLLQASAGARHTLACNTCSLRAAKFRSKSYIKLGSSPPHAKPPETKYWQLFRNMSP